MAGYVPKLADAGFQQWIKANLALNITKDGIKDAVCNTINTFHQDALNDILTPEQIKNNDICTQCTTPNILLYQSEHYRPCPKRICDQLKDRIRKCHRFKKPSWKNTRPERWCQYSWELAKCYFPPDGYTAVNTIEETDLNGILSLLLNQTAFKRIVDEQTCEETRDIGRGLRHSPSLCIDENAMNSYLDTLVKFLSCSSLFQADSKATESVQKIKQLKADILAISTEDITKVLQDVIQENTRDSMNEINKTAARLASEIKTDLGNLEAVRSTNLTEILTAKTNVISDINKSKNAGILEINEKVAIGTTNIELAAEQLKASFKNKQITDEEYHLLKKFKEDLLTFMREYHSEIPISPLLRATDTDIVGFYVPPALNCVELYKPTLRGQCSEVRRPISGLKDVFYKKLNRCSNVFLTSDAGQGKTAFCKYLALIWCDAHQNNKERQYITDTDMHELQDFEFLFLISLRDAAATYCDIDDMIQNQIVQYLSRTFKYNANFVQELLHRERHLVILDGLDEWMHPEPTITCRKKRDYLPHRKARKKCTILTTTRSWKLSIANLKPSQIDNHIEIGSLDEKASKQLISNTVTRIHSHQNIEGDIEQNVEDMCKEIRLKSIPEFEVSPLILTHLICLLVEGKPLGKSKCEVYSNVLELLLFRANIKSTDSQTCDNKTVPLCFQKKDQIKSFYNTLLSLGRLAFQALFSTERERSLVFETSFVKSILTEEALNFSRSTGLLVQSKFPGQLNSNETRISFSHKTFQEYFAALYIQSQSDQYALTTKEVLKNCCNVERILEMSNVFIFLSGLAPKIVSLLSKKFYEIINDDTMTKSYRKRHPLYISDREPFKKLQDMYIACVKESEDNNQKTVHLIIGDIFLDQESYNESHLRILQKLIRMNIKYIMSVFLVHLASEGETNTTLTTFHLEKIQTFEKLCLHCPIMTDDLESLLRASAETLQHVTVQGGKRQKDGYSKVCNVVSDISVNTVINFQHLESLNLTNTRVSHPGLESLTSYLTERTSMKEVYMCNILCADHEEYCSGFSMDLSQHSHLECLGFGKIPLSKLQINTAYLETCFVGEITCQLKDSNVVSSVLNYLPEARYLQNIHLFELDTAIDSVLETIPKLVHLQRIEIYHTDMGDKKIELSGLPVEYIFMGNTIMSSAAFEHIVEGVEAFEKSIRVELIDCTISPADKYEQIKEHIKSSDKFGSKEECNRFIFETV